MSEESVERLLGELIGTVRGMAGDISDLKKADSANAEKRAGMYKTIDDVKSDLSGVKIDVTLIKKEMEDTKPDIERCRMFRHWGIVSASLIAFGLSVFAFWDHIRKLMP